MNVASIAITLVTERYLDYFPVKPVESIRAHMHVLARGERGKQAHQFNDSVAMFRLAKSA